MVAESREILDSGDVAPAFSLPDTDGETVSLETLSGYDVLVLVFTCNHCPYAEAKHPILNEITADYDDVAVVGINPNDPAQYEDDSYEEMQARVESGEIQYDHYLYDETQAVAAAYGAVCTPDPYVFASKNGEFELTYHGRIDDAPNPEDEPSHIEIRDAIDATLAGEPVPIEEQPSRGCSIKWRPGNEPDYWN